MSFPPSLTKGEIRESIPDDEEHKNVVIEKIKGGNIIWLK
jgi:hypothetical protein